jgi:hypothetical protein
MPDCINKEARTSFGHTLTCSLERKFGAAVGEEGRERERRVLGRGLSVFV